MVGATRHGPSREGLASSFPAVGPGRHERLRRGPVFLGGSGEWRGGDAGCGHFVSVVSGVFSCGHLRPECFAAHASGDRGGDGRPATALPWGHGVAV